jgi:hypothetical protein
MTARSEVTPELIERLMPAYRRLLRMARENQAAAQAPPSGQKERAASSTAAPSDVDLKTPDQRLSSCPPQG